MLLHFRVSLLIRFQAKMVNVALEDGSLDTQNAGITMLHSAFYRLSTYKWNIYTCIESMEHYSENAVKAVGRRCY